MKGMFRKDRRGDAGPDRAGDGEVAASFVGVRPKEDLVEALTKVI